MKKPEVRVVRRDAVITAHLGVFFHHPNVITILFYRFTTGKKNTNFMTFKYENFTNKQSHVYVLQYATKNAKLLGKKKKKLFSLLNLLDALGRDRSRDVVQ